MDPHAICSWKLKKHQFAFDFQNLVFFIRYFSSFTIFYMIVWMFRNRSSHVRELSYTFTFYNSLLCSVLSIYYLFSASKKACLLALASMCSYMLADMYYGWIHYHSFMCGLSGYLHHIAYFIVILYSIYYDWINVYGAFLIVEIPTFLLNIKYFFQYEGFAMDFSIFVGFLLFRVLGWGLLIQQNMDIAREYKFTLSTTFVALLLHIYWTGIHGRKIIRKYFG